MQVVLDMLEDMQSRCHIPIQHSEEKRHVSLYVSFSEKGKLLQKPSGSSHIFAQKWGNAHQSLSQLLGRGKNYMSGLSSSGSSLLGSWMAEKDGHQNKTLLIQQSKHFTTFWKIFFL